MLRGHASRYIMSAQASTAAAGASAEVAPSAVSDHDRDAVVAKRIVRKIDRVIMPLLFVTYMLNFMDKIILSSAAVFGLRDDNVSRPSRGRTTATTSPTNTSRRRRTSRDRNTAGSAASSTLVIWSGNCPPTF